MAYPFLPVNPCCTDVVLNTPCGCSSTITNSGCNNNNPCSTHLTASSTIVYDGPVLPCIVAEPCDTLNVILQKIDEIICNLLTQINYLTNQVTNINIQINNINGDIINIYNTLDECCGATTTTTSTTTAAPCESFSLDNTGPDPVAIIITDCITGEQEAIVLLPGETDICVETDSPLTVPGTVIVTPNGPCGPTTTTTTSSSSTTTTTTTVSPCECLTFYNDSVSSQEITYIDCNGVDQYNIILPYATNSYCGCCGQAPGSPDVSITIGANCIDGLCPAEPTTTTTTTIAPCNCFDTEITITSEILAITDNGQVTVLYEDCFTNPYIDTYNRPGVYPLGCVDYLVGITALGQVDGVESSIYVPITVGSPCCDIVPPTSSTTTTAPTLVLELIGCCVDETEYVLYNPALATIPSVFTATNGQPYDLVSATPITGVPTVTITDFTNYNTCANWLAINLNCPATTTTTTTLSCNCVDVIISQDDLDDATGNTLPFFDGKVNLFPDKNLTCEDGDLEAYYSVAGTYSYCLKGSVIPTIILQYVKDDNVVTSVQSQIVNLGTPCLVNGECIPTTTTTSSSTSTTTSSTSTTTSTSSTTTTTTTAFVGACTCMDVTISQTDLDDATGNTLPAIENNTVYLQSAKSSGCDGSDVERTYADAVTDSWCIKTSEIGTVQLFYYKNDVPIYFPSIDSTYTILYSTCSVNGDCAITTTTSTSSSTTTTTTTIEPTTTTTTTLGDCLYYSYEGGIDGGTFTFVNCVLDPEEVYFVNPNETGFICFNTLIGTSGTVSLTLIGNCPF